MNWTRVCGLPDRHANRKLQCARPNVVRSRSRSYWNIFARALGGARPSDIFLKIEKVSKKGKKLQIFFHIRRAQKISENFRSLSPNFAYAPSCAHGSWIWLRSRPCSERHSYKRRSPKLYNGNPYTTEPILILNDVSFNFLWHFWIMWVILEPSWVLHSTQMTKILLTWQDVIFESENYFHNSEQLSEIIEVSFCKLVLSMSIRWRLTCSSHFNLP